MTDKLREGYRDRLKDGQVVYFVEGENVIGGGNLTVKKANVTGTSFSDGRKRHYPFIVLWDRIDEDPGRTVIATSMSPRELFTEEEVLRSIRQHEGPLGIDDRAVDELIANPLANLELTAVLGGVAMSRLAEDEFRNPGDPEY